MAITDVTADDFADGEAVTVVLRGRRYTGRVVAKELDRHLGAYLVVQTSAETVRRYPSEVRHCG